MKALRTAYQWAARAARLMVGVPDYQTYVEHRRSAHPGEPIMTEGDEGDDLFIIRSGSMVVEKSVGGKQVFLSYVPAGSYSGEMALLDGGRRTATVKAAIRSQVVRLPGEPFRIASTMLPGPVGEGGRKDG